MIRHLLKLVTAIALMCGGLTFVAPAAFAETAHAEAHATSTGDLNVDSTVKAATALNTNADGKVVGAWVRNPGPKGHWKPARALKVPFAKNYNKGVASCKPFRLRHGKWMPRTLKRRDGVLMQVEGGTHVKFRWSLFDQGKTCSQVRHRGYYNPRKHKWQGDCVNPKPTPNMPSYPASEVVEVRQHTSIDYSFDLDWSAWAIVYGSVSVDCGGGNNSSSSFSAKGSTNGSLTLKVTASSRAEAEAKAKKLVEASIKSKASVKTDIMVSGEASAEGTAVANCSSTPPPPPAYQAPNINISAGACVKPGEQTGVVNGTVSNANNEAKTGVIVTLSPGNKTTTVNLPANGSVSFNFSGLAPDSYTASVTAFGKTVSDTATVTQCDTPPPPANKPPTGEIVQAPEHLFPGGEYRAKVVGSDPEDGGNVTLDYKVTGGADKIVDANHPEICDVEGTQRVCYFWIRAGQTAGVNATLTLIVKDSKGLTSEPYVKTWPIVADQF